MFKGPHWMENNALFFKLRNFWKLGNFLKCDDPHAGNFSHFLPLFNFEGSIKLMYIGQMINLSKVVVHTFRQDLTSLSNDTNKQYPKLWTGQTYKVTEPDQMTILDKFLKTLSLWGVNNISLYWSYGQLKTEATDLMFSVFFFV